MSIPGNGSGASEGMERLEDEINHEPQPMYSNCCYARMSDPDSDRCPKCREHCEAIDEGEADFERSYGADRF